MLYYIVLFALFGAQLMFVECEQDFPSFNRIIYSTSVIISWNEDARYTYSFLLDQYHQDNTCEDGFKNVSSPATFNTTSDGISLEALTDYRSALCAFNLEGVSRNNRNLRMAPTPPSNLRPTRNESNLLEVEWEDYCNIENSTCPDNRKARNYIVTNQEIDGGSSSAKVIRPNFKATNKTIESLHSNTNYKITVTIRVSSNVMSNRAFLVATTVPDKVNPFNLTSSNNTITLKWNRVPGNADVNYTIIKNGKRVFTDVKSNIATLDGLTSNTNYELQVKAVNVGGDGEPSEIQTFPTLSNPPTIFTSCNTTNKSTEVCFGWMKPEGGDAIIKEYIIQWNMSYNEIKNHTIFHNAENTSYTFTIDQLLPGYQVNIMIAAKNAAGLGEFTPRILATFPSEPRNVEFTSKSDEISLKWKNPFGNFDEIRIESDFQQFDPISISNQATSQYTIKKLTPRTTYNISIYSVFMSSTGRRLESDKYQTTITTKKLTENSSIIGPIGGSIFAVFVIVVVIVFLIYFKRRNNSKSENSQMVSSAENVPESRLNETLMFQNKITPQTSATVQSQSQQLEVVYDVPNQSREFPQFVLDFYAHIDEMKLNHNEKFGIEFKNLASASEGLETHTANDLSNKKKNRFKNVQPYDYNLVVLERSKQFPNNYINASFIEGYKRKAEYIATQGPLQSTTDDFWRMAWQENCTDIVMVTQLVENTKKKCCKYWPDYQEVFVCGEDIAIVNISENEDLNWTVRQLQISKNGESRNVTQFHYTVWPDHDVPNTTDNLIAFVKYVRSKINQNPSNGPTIVHCSAGVGRTGTFIALDYLLQHLENDPETIDIHGLIYRMRTQRMNMVQTQKQYIFLHKCVEDYLNMKYGSIKRNQENTYENISQYQNIEPIYENSCVPYVS